MFLLGIIGIMQVLFFPGLILRKLVRFPNELLMNIACVVASSLIINYLIVFFLTSIGVFTTWLCIIILFVELFILSKIYWNFLISIKIDFSFVAIWNKLIQTIQELFPLIDYTHHKRFHLAMRLFFTFVFFVASLVVIDWIFGFLTYNIGRVFENWDAVVSWNRWAMDWFQNTFPKSTQDYPQLIPISWAMIYKITGTSNIQFFAKGIMPFFPLLIILLIFSLGLKTKQFGYFIAAVIIRYLFKRIVGEHLISGYVDLTLTFFTLLSVIMLFYLHNENSPDEKKRLYLFSVFFASGAAVTKQPGLFVLVVNIIVGFFMINGFRKIIINKKNLNCYLSIICLVLIIVVPWYGMKLFEFIEGVDTSHFLNPISDTTQSYNSENIFALLNLGLRSLGNPFYVSLLVLPSLIVINKFWRLVGLYLVVPYAIIWAIYASYDTRNFSLVIPLIAIIVGLGFQGIFEVLLEIIFKTKITKVPIITIPVILLITIAFGSILFPNEKLLDLQIQKQKQIFSPSLNSQLYDFIDANGLKGEILTNYPLEYLPELNGIQVVYNFKDLDLLIELIQKENIHYLLYPENSDETVLSWIEAEKNSGKINIIFTNSDFIPYTFAEIKK